MNKGVTAAKTRLQTRPACFTEAGEDSLESTEEKQVLRMSTNSLAIVEASTMIFKPTAQCKYGVKKLQYCHFILLYWHHFWSNRLLTTLTKLLVDPLWTILSVCLL